MITEAENSRTHSPDLAFQILPAIATYLPSGLQEAYGFRPRSEQRAFFRMTQREQIIPLPATAILLALDRQMTDQLAVQTADISPLPIGLPRDDFSVVLVGQRELSLLNSAVAFLNGVLTLQWTATARCLVRLDRLPDADAPCRSNSDMTTTAAVTRTDLWRRAYLRSR